MSGRGGFGGEVACDGAGLVRDWCWGGSRRWRTLAWSEESGELVGGLGGDLREVTKSDVVNGRGAGEKN